VLVEILIIAVIIGLLPAFIARSKGYNFFGWWLFGALLWIVAFPMALTLKPNKKVIEARQMSLNDMKKCPQCAELIKREAKVCRFCGVDVSPQATSAAADIVSG